MTLQSIPGAAVDGALKIIRVPADRLLGDRKGRVASSVGVAVDRADAAVRGAAGTVLRDSELKDGAQRRRRAAGKRERALDLRERADERIDQASTQADKRQAEAAERRRKADRDAKRKREQAKDRADQKKARAAKAERSRKQSAQQAAAKSESKIEQKAKVDRLDQLESKSDALKVKAAALTAADEAKRLEKAASRTKERRKSENGSSR